MLMEVGQLCAVLMTGTFIIIKKLLFLTASQCLDAVQVMQLENQKRYNTLAMPTLLWGRWNWTLKETGKSRITAAEILFLRKGANFFPFYCAPFSTKFKRPEIF
jgi:hypothetical protein